MLASDTINAYEWKKSTKRSIYQWPMFNEPFYWSCNQTSQLESEQFNLEINSVWEKFPLCKLRFIEFKRVISDVAGRTVSPFTFIHVKCLWSLFILIVKMSDLPPRGLEAPWIGSEFSWLRPDVFHRSSFIRSQSFSNCLVRWSVAALICRTTSSDVMGTLELAAALSTTSTSWLPKLWVSSY